MLFSQNENVSTKVFEVEKYNKTVLKGEPLQFLSETEHFNLNSEAKFSWSSNILNKQAQVNKSISNIFQPVAGPYGGTVRSIAMDSDGWLYLGTDGEVYVSKDNGLNWEMNLFPSQLHNFVSPVTILGPNVVVAETDWSNFISKDRGESWEYLHSDVRGFAVDTNGVIYAGSEYNGLKISIDTAKTWQNFALSGKKIRKVILCGEGRLVCPSDSGTYYSTDCGIRWNFKSYDTIPTWTIVGDKKGNLYSPNTSRYSELYRSKDFGETWETISLPTNDRIYRIYVENDGKILATTTKDILVSANKGETWKVINFYALTLRRDVAGNLLAGSFSGVHRYDSLSGEWNEINTGIRGRRIEGIAHTDAGSIIILSLGKIFKSDDLGITWSSIIPDSGVYVYYYTPILSTSNGSIFIAASFQNLRECGLLRSTDNGETWEKISVLSNYYAIYGIAEGPSGDILVSTYFGDIYRSIDDGDSWSKVVISNNQSEITCIAADTAGNYYAAKDSVMFISRDGVKWEKSNFTRGYASHESMCIDSHNEIFLSSSRDGVYHSADLGNTWNKMNSGLFDKYIMSSTSDDSGNVVLGTSDGIFRLADASNSWLYYNDGFPKTFTTSISISPQGYLFAGTQSFGLYRSIEPLASRTPSIEQYPKVYIYKFGLYQNYPNPFNNNTVIHFKVPFKANVVVKIYNIQGQLVANLISKEIQEGDYTINWEPKELASGVYFCRMEASTNLKLYQKTIKLMYLK